MLTVLNIDVVITGLHFAGGHGHMVLAENCNTTVTNCTFTDTGGVSIRNSSIGVAFTATFERCFLRNSKLAALAGPQVSLDVRECGAIGTMRLIDCMLDEEQSVNLQKCTFIDCCVLNVACPTKNHRPKIPLTFRIDQSLGNLTACCHFLVAVTAPKEFLSINTVDDANLALTLAFRKIEAKNSFWAYWSWWATVARSDGGEGFNIAAHGTFELPVYDGTISFADQVELVRKLIHEKGDSEGASQLRRTLLPDQLAVTPGGPMAELRDKGIIVGCDVTLLPVPPPITLEP